MSRILSLDSEAVFIQIMVTMVICFLLLVALPIAFRDVIKLQILHLDAYIFVQRGESVRNYTHGWGIANITKSNQKLAYNPASFLAFVIAVKFMSTSERETESHTHPQ